MPSKTILPKRNDSTLTASASASGRSSLQTRGGRCYDAMQGATTDALA